MLGQFVAAWFGRRMTSRRVLIYGVVVAAACNIELAWLVDSHEASAYLWMCATMGVHGFAQATGSPHNVARFANGRAARSAERCSAFGEPATPVIAGRSQSLAAILLHGSSV
jgi:hypothetical protein